MKDSNWKIKISEFLSNPWKVEKITLVNKYMNGFNIIWDKWISWNILIRWLNSTEIFITILDLNTDIKTSCDICFEDYIYNIEIINKEVIFMLEENRRSTWEIHDKEFIINPKDKTINLEEFIYQLLTISEPLIKNCWKHKNNNVIDDIENNISNSWWNILWK